MRKACLQNLKAAGALQGAHDNGKGMLLFYSSECGLKHIIMNDQGHRNSAIVASSFGHNIRSLVAEAKISRSELAQGPGSEVTFPNLRKKGEAAMLSLSDFHVAMRYGIELDADDETNAMMFFDRLTTALKKRLTE